MKKLILLLLILCNYLLYSQKTRFPIWTTSENTNIIGLSIDLPWIKRNSNKKFSKTYGVRIEPNLLAPLYLLASKIPTDLQTTQKIYGINITTVAMEKMDAHGISITGFFNNLNNSNGISLSILTNTIKKANGIVIGFGGNSISKGNGIMVGGPWLNTAEEFSGVQISFENNILDNGAGIQIGVINKARKFKGIQIGLWNKIGTGAFPLINWNFK